MANNGGVAQKYDGSKLTRHDFASDFIFGAASSAYQVEGAYRQDDRGPCNWDAWSFQRPDKITDGKNGSVAIDHYNQFKEDVKLMKKLGLDAYRLSIAWSRILPGGRLSKGGINKKGVKFYNDLIDQLLAEGITPFVTIFHFDVPQALEAEYGGFLSRNIVADFVEYADVCFFEFGDRVKFWITQNEPWTFAHHGYVTGTFPPGHGATTTNQPSGSNRHVKHRCPRGIDNTCTGGDAGTEPYIVAHNLLLAHAAAVDLYRNTYQAVQGGKIGVTNMTTWYDPYDATSPDDVAAASRAVDFMWGWFVAPIVTGDYPPVMRQRVDSRLPKFTPEEAKSLKGSFDFIGMNYYTVNLASYKPTAPGRKPTYDTDQEAEFHYSFPDGTPVGEKPGSDWLYIAPYGIYKLLKHTKDTYNNPIVYITENGADEENDSKLPVGKALQDDYRIKYYQNHLAYIKQAIDDGVNLKGFILWALFDNYEWAEGYAVRFGIYYVDYDNFLIRYPKKSAKWYMKFLNRNTQQLPSTKRSAAVNVEEVVEADNSSVKRKRNR